MVTKITFILSTFATMVLYNSLMEQIFQQTEANGTIIQWLVQQTGMAGIAVLSLIMLNQVWKSRVEAEKKHAEEINTIRGETLETLRKNVEVITRLTEKLE